MLSLQAACVAQHILSINLNEMAELTRPEIDGDVITELVTQHRRSQWIQTIASTKTQLEFQELVRGKVKDVKGFWQWTLYQHQGFHAAAASRQDMDALSFLTDVEMKKDPEDPREVELIFTFDENPYFSDKTLSKKFVLHKDKAGDKEKIKAGEFTTDLLNFNPDEDLDSVPTEIHWKSDDKNLCKLQPSPKFDSEDFDGDLGSIFNWFTSDADPLSIRNIIAEEILADTIDYFMSQGEFSVSDVEDDSDDELDESGGDDDEEIDLEAEEPKKKKIRTA